MSLPSRDQHVAAELFNRPWALTESKLHEMVAVYERHRSGAMLSAEDISAAIGTADKPAPQRYGNAIAVVPVYGVIAYRMDMMTAISGGTSLQRLGAMMQDAIADPNVRTLVLRFETPGGSIDGLTEMAAKIRDMRGRGKKIIASVDMRALSAGYWLASQCDEICCTTSGYVGAIGIVVSHRDSSEAMRKAGDIVEVISVPAKKAELLQPGPLSDMRRARTLDVMQQAYAMFVADVAKGRNVTAGRVESKYGGGDLLTASEALAVKMVDRVESFDETLARLSDGRSPILAISARANADGALETAATTALDLEAGVVPKDVSEKLAPKDTPWAALTLADFTDQPWESLSTGERRHIAGHFGWSASMPPESFGDLKLGHHRPSDGAVVSRGVTNALARLDQTKLPAGDASKVRAHLERHQAAFEKQDGKAAAASFRHLAAEDAPDDAIDDQAIEPVDGICADGYELRDDGMCYPTPEPTEDDTDAERQAAADQDAIAIALALQK